MSHSNTAGHSVADIYKSVINDVIAQVREAFLDENVDIDVLSQLKKEWEEKVAQSGCVDMDHRPAPGAMRAVVPNAHPERMVQRPQPQHVVQQHVRIQPSTQQILAQQQHLSQVQQIDQAQQLHQQVAQRIQQQQQQHNVQVSQQQPLFVQQQAVHAIPLQMQSINGQSYMGGQLINLGVPVQRYAAVHSIANPMMQGQPLVLQSGAQLLQHQRIIMQQQPQAGNDHVRQLDGNGGTESEGDGQPCSSLSLDKKQKKKKGKKSKPSRKEAESVARELCRVLQMDGGRGGGMSDSSSEEEEEEDDDPLRRIADRIGDGEGADGDADINEEEPLNSEDDQSDDEDLVTLFDADNVVMCQFEKVSRARSKWKFSLKDGIMHMNGKDFCFQKCTGEADW